MHGWAGGAAPKGEAGSLGQLAHASRASPAAAGLDECAAPLFIAKENVRGPCGRAAPVPLPQDCQLHSPAAGAGASGVCSCYRPLLGGDVGPVQG